MRKNINKLEKGSYEDKNRNARDVIFSQKNEKIEEKHKDMRKTKINQGNEKRKVLFAYLFFGFHNTTLNEEA